MSFNPFSNTDEDFNSTISRKSVTVNVNGEFDKGKVLYMEPEWSLHDFLNAASNRLGAASLKRVFSSDGVDIDDCMMIEDNDILFISNGDDFIPPMTTGSDNEDGDVTICSTIAGYRVGKMLGRGGFGEVRIGEHHLTGEQVALKFLRKAEIISMGAVERTTTEIQCLSALRHQHIIRMHQQLESPHHVVLVLELMEGGDLFNYLLDRQDNVGEDVAMQSSFQQGLPEDEARHVFGQILSAVGYAHNQHICHRDLKLENILLKTKNLSCVKIADFGLSAFYRPGAMMKSSCGTLSFLAPEVFAGTSNAGPPLDVWAMGVILFALLCGRLPFEGPDLRGTKRPRDAVIRSRISKGHYKIEESLSPEAKDLVRRLLRVDPAVRSTVPEIFSHIWLRGSSSVTFDVAKAISHPPNHVHVPVTTDTSMSSLTPKRNHGITDDDLNDSLDRAQEVNGNMRGPCLELMGSRSRTPTNSSSPDVERSDGELVSQSRSSAKEDHELDMISVMAAFENISEEDEDLSHDFEKMTLPIPTFEDDIRPSSGLTMLRRDSKDIDDLIPIPPRSPARGGRMSLESSVGNHLSLAISEDHEEDMEEKNSVGIVSPRTPPPPSSFVLVPLRRNAPDIAKNSPRRPRTSAGSEMEEIVRYESNSECFDEDDVSYHEATHHLGDSRHRTGMGSSPSNGGLYSKNSLHASSRHSEDGDHATFSNKRLAKMGSCRPRVQSWTDQVEGEKGKDNTDELNRMDAIGGESTQSKMNKFGSPSSSRNKLHMAGSLSLKSTTIGTPNNSARRYVGSPSSHAEKRSGMSGTNGHEGVSTRDRPNSIRSRFSATDNGKNTSSANFSPASRAYGKKVIRSQHGPGASGGVI